MNEVNNLFISLTYIILHTRSRATLQIVDMNIKYKNKKHNLLVPIYIYHYYIILYILLYIPYYIRVNEHQKYYVDFVIDLYIIK